jgi:hypothetical protein
MARAASHSKTPVKFLLFLASISTYIAVATLRWEGWIFFAIMALYSLFAILFRWGWLMPCTITGTYLGVVAMPFPHFGSPTDENEAFVAIGGAISGFIVGLLVDATIEENQNRSDDEKS